MLIQEILTNRQIERSEPGNRSDPYKLGLAIEGGGMRGVISGGMTAALENLGLSKSFDTVYGSSAGSMAGAFLVTGAAARGCTTYHKHLNNSKFIAFSNILKNKSIMNLDYLLDEVFGHMIPLDYTGVRLSTLPLKCVITNAETAQPKLLHGYHSDCRVKRALKASACNPLIAGRGVRIDESLYIDAAVSEPIPIRSAVNDDCTHILVLRTVIDNWYRPKVGGIERVLAKNASKAFGPLFYQNYIEGHKIYDRCVEQILALGERAECIHPRINFEISPLTRDTGRLRMGMYSGYRAVLNHFGIDYKFLGNSLMHH